MTIGERLRFERRRVKLTQHAVAAACGRKMNSQILYETGKRYPRADYLLAVANLGVDVHYVLSGQRAPEMSQVVLPDEAELLRLMRNLASEDLQALHHLISRLCVMQAEASQLSSLTQQLRGSELSAGYVAVSP